MRYNTSNQCCVNTTFTDDDQINLDNLLWELNEELMIKRIPAIVFVSILALVGSFGNGLVMLTYRAHIHKSTVNVFIFWMSVCDFSLCFFEMPYKAFEIRFPLMYGYPVICKGFSFLEIFLSMVSIILLLCIAFDRYFVIQRPLQRLTLDNIYKIICVCALLGLLFSWPTLFVYGTFSQRTRVPGLYGWGCGVANHMLKSKITRCWYYFLYAVFLVSSILLITLYVRIWISIRRWKYTMIGESMSSPNTKSRAVVTLSVNVTGSTRSKSSSKYETYTDIPSERQPGDTENLDQPESSPKMSQSNAETSCGNEFVSMCPPKKLYNGLETTCGNGSVAAAQTKKSESDTETRRNGSVHTPSPTGSDSDTDTPCGNGSVSVCPPTMSHSDTATPCANGRASGLVPSESQSDVDKPIGNGSGPTFLPINDKDKSTPACSLTASKTDITSLTSPSKERPRQAISSVTPSATRTVKHARMRRNTLIFGAIASVFVLSYLPILVIIFLRTSGLYDLTKAPLWQAQLFEVLHRSGYINNAVNPFIYAFLSPWFRLHVRRAFCD